MSHINDLSYYKFQFISLKEKYKIKVHVVDEKIEKVQMTIFKIHTQEHKNVICILINQFQLFILCTNNSFHNNAGAV